MPPKRPSSPQEEANPNARSSETPVSAYVRPRSLSRERAACGRRRSRREGGLGQSFGGQRLFDQADLVRRIEDREVAPQTDALAIAAEEDQAIAASALARIDPPLLGKSDPPVGSSLLS